MSKLKFKFFSTTQAIAILSVDNIKVDDIGQELLMKRELGLITYEEARAQVRAQAKVFANNSSKNK